MLFFLNLRVLKCMSCVIVVNSRSRLGFSFHAYEIINTLNANRHGKFSMVSDTVGFDPSV